MNAEGMDNMFLPMVRSMVDVIMWIFIGWACVVFGLLVVKAIKNHLDVKKELRVMHGRRPDPLDKYTHKI